MGVSRFPRRPRSARSFATIPDDVMYVTPARSRAASGPQPSSNPARKPGVALSTRSTKPEGAPARRLPVSSSAVYSSPRVKSRRTTPIDAPTSMNSAETSGGRSEPMASPTSRYTGIGEISNGCGETSEHRQHEQDEAELEQDGRDLAAAGGGEGRQLTHRGAASLLRRPPRPSRRGRRRHRPAA